MQLNQLRSFIAIARDQNLTRASESLYLSQSAVSNQIKLLEEELGLRLFKRTSKNMLLTDEGQALIGYARSILKATENMLQKAEALNQGLSSSIVIGLNTDATFLKVSAINQRFRSLYPDTSVAFQISQSTDTAQKLQQGQIDLGFFYGDEEQPGIESTIVNNVRICVVVPATLAPANKELTWDEITDLPWVWVDKDFPFYRVLQRNMDDHTTTPIKAVTAVDEQIVRELAATGQGVAIMREDEARPLAEQGLVRIWNRGWGEIPLRLGWLATNSREQQIQSALEVVNHVWRGPGEKPTSCTEAKYWY